MPMEETEVTWRQFILKKKLWKRKHKWKERGSLKGAALRHICDSGFLTFPCQMYPGLE